MISPFIIAQLLKAQASNDDGVKIDSFFVRLYYTGPMDYSTQ